MNTIYKSCAAACGAVVSFVTGVPAILWVLLGAMSIDFFTGLVCGAAGVSDKSPQGHLSSTAARTGVLRKVMTLLVVLLASLLDLAVQTGAGVSFSAVTGATCLWFIAGEGVSILENAALLGLPMPRPLLQALEIMREKSGGAPLADGEDV